MAKAYGEVIEKRLKLLGGMNEKQQSRDSQNADVIANIKDDTVRKKFVRDNSLTDAERAAWSAALAAKVRASDEERKRKERDQVRVDLEWEEWE